MSFSEQYIALKTIIIREILRFMGIWIQTLLPPAITTTLYFIIFGQFIGSQLAAISGYAYIDYIVPGLILMSVMTNAYANVVSSFYSAKFQRNIEEMLISPMPIYIIISGYVVGGVFRGFIVGIVVFIISLFFTTLPLPYIGWALLVMVLTAILFSLAGLINGIYARSFDDISIIPTFVLTPLTYLGGIFYSLQLLPDFWQKVSLFNPMLYMINGFRYSMLGISDTSLVSSILVILVFIVLFAGICFYLLDKGVGVRQ